MIAFAAIAPHGDVDAAPELRAAMEELGRRFDASGCTVAVVVTPHSVHVEGHYAVVTAAKVGEHETDRALAAELVDTIRAAGLPVVGVSYGGNEDEHRWNCTEASRRGRAGWRIVQTHWSFTGRGRAP